MPVIQLEKPADRPLADWFSELREWLDRHQCDAHGFTRTGRHVDRQVYLISVEDGTKAREFSHHFARYDPVVRRPTLVERPLTKFPPAAAD